MNVLLINSVCGYGSTGRIVLNIAKEYEQQGATVKIAYGRRRASEDSEQYAIRIGRRMDICSHMFRSILLDEHGLGSKHATKRFLHWADGFDPDILWIHNIHGYYINYIELFKWIKSRPNMQVKWTFHDCWPITGHCAHFLDSKCEKWKNGCDNCKEYRRYPISILLEQCKKNYYQKKNSFTKVSKMQIIVPADWLKNCIQESFLKQYDIIVRKNKADENYFYIFNNYQIVKEIYSKYIDYKKIDHKKIILGVANIWPVTKGLHDFEKLAEILPVDEYAIVLVGLSKKQIKRVSEKILGVMRTSSRKELAAFYNGAFMYVNLSYEETFPTTNLEAVACGTPVIAYDTGGCRETLSKHDFLVSEGDINRVAEIIMSYEKN